MDLHYKKTPRIWTLLNADSGILRKLIQHIDLLKEIEQKLASFLGHPLSEHYIIANYANDTLVLYADTPSWASRIRYNTPQIMLFLQNEYGLGSLKTIRIKVTPSSAQSVHLPDKRWKLDKHTANLISQSASSITDETLKCLLLKISKHF